MEWSSHQKCVVLNSDPHAFKIDVLHINHYIGYLSRNFHWFYIIFLLYYKIHGLAFNFIAIYLIVFDKFICIQELFVYINTWNVKL